MIFTETAVQGSYIIDLDLVEDQRGFFARTFCNREFAAHGLQPDFIQCNISLNHMRGALRGLHFQLPPAAETKLVRVVRGAVYDVVVDLRTDSPTYMNHLVVELTAENRRALYVPEMCAHGYQTLTDDVEILYQMGAAYAPELARGVRYDDQAFGINWPLPVTDISQKDRSWPSWPRQIAAT
jgi:dTDP-4-dehydrorhamnose 3,5-epimerase